MTKHEQTYRGGDEQQTAEVHPFPRRRDGRTFEQAKQELAALKFGLFETVAADPLLRGSPCLAVAVVFASLVTVDKRTLEFTAAYVSNGKLHVRAGLRSHNTAQKARRLLEKHGYLTAVGSTNGMTVYQIANPHQERVLMHVREWEDHNREVKAEQKRNWRLQVSGMSKPDTPKNSKDVKNRHPGMSNSDTLGCQKMTPNTLKEYLSVLPENIRSEGKGYLPHDVERGIYGQGDEVKGEVSEATQKPARTDPDLNEPTKKNRFLCGVSIIDAPRSEADAFSELYSLFGEKWPLLHDNVRRSALMRLMNGRLTHEWVQERIVNLDTQIAEGDA
ncbi:hypothetical protein HWD97_02470 [Ochrobactrum sp. C6C9]|uniref:hypothetical protein n=1 Tax=Ochrobactrum sp. C6C9 TaxID=2736662 RepID=UPI0035304497|nr:hypothetical protein [Ochrobactrum sp. C6C9]